MANGAYKFYKDLPPWAKGVVVVGGLAIIYFTARTVVKKISKLKETKDSKESVKDAENDIRTLTNNGVRPTYSPTQYKTWANKIEQSFEGCDPWGNITWGADSPLGAISYWSRAGYKVATTFNLLKNDVDYLSLVSAWGVRTYDDCGPGLITGDVKDVDLAKAIADELDDREISNLNKILAKKGIKYKI